MLLDKNSLIMIFFGKFYRYDIYKNGYEIVYKNREILGIVE